MTEHDSHEQRDSVRYTYRGSYHQVPLYPGGYYGHTPCSCRRASIQYCTQTRVYAIGDGLPSTSNPYGTVLHKPGGTPCTNPVQYQSIFTHIRTRDDGPSKSSFLRSMHGMVPYAMVSLRLVRSLPEYSYSYPLIAARVQAGGRSQTLLPCNIQPYHMGALL